MQDGGQGNNAEVFQNGNGNQSWQTQTYGSNNVAYANQIGNGNQNTQQQN
jgi:hypothetical protein